MKHFVFIVLTLCVTLTQAQGVCLGHTLREIKKEWKHVGQDTSFTDYQGRDVIRYVLPDSSFATYTFEKKVCVAQVNGYSSSNPEVARYTLDKLYPYIDDHWEGTDIRGYCFSANLLYVKDRMLVLYERLPACG